MLALNNNQFRLKYHRLVQFTQTSEKTEGAMQIGEYRETGNIGYTRRRQTKQKHRETGNMGYTRRRQTKQKHKHKQHE